MARSAMSSNILVKILLFPAFVYFFTKKKTKISIDTLCMGYHVVAKKNEKKAKTDYKYYEGNIIPDFTYENNESEFDFIENNYFKNGKTIKKKRVNKEELDYSSNERKNFKNTMTTRQTLSTI